MSTKTRKLAYCAVCVALVAILSQIAVPIGPVPINLAVFGVFLTGVLLGPIWGTGAMCVYLLLGIAGVPVFAAFKAGISAIAGPTGGFIFAYPICTLIIGFITKRFPKLWVSVAAMIAALCVLYLFGALWFTLYLKSSFSRALSVCVFPFIPGDLIKIALAAPLGVKLKKILFRNSVSKKPLDPPNEESSAEISAETCVSIEKSDQDDQ